MQLLNDDGEVVESTVSSSTGHYVFDNLSAGTYSVRFAGVPAGYRLTPPRAGDDPDEDSDPDYTGVTPPFTLGVGEAKSAGPTRRTGSTRRTSTRASTPESPPCAMRSATGSGTT